MTAPTLPKLDIPAISTGLGGLSATAFDVVIVGSGYGGSIAASRLARAGKTVCLLERGREIRPGAYPTDPAGAAGEIQVATARNGRLDPAANGLMDLRVNEDVNVIVGCGLGGGSLVNAGVSIEPDMRVFLADWPTAYKPAVAAGQMALSNILSAYFPIVRKKLGAASLPDSIPLPKLSALEQSAKAMNQPFERASINVTFETGPNHFGLIQPACTLCGDCCSGCNYGSKNTLLMNYLPDAAANGAVIVTEAEVTTIAPSGSGWTVNVTNRSGTPVADKALTAGTLILAAGALGSTEILFRSTRAAGGPTFSPALGSRFSANGDVLGFGFGANVTQTTTAQPQPLYSIGAGSNPALSDPYRPGPCITGVIRVNMGQDDPLASGLVIEDGTAPGPFAALYPPALFLQDALSANFSDFPDATQRLQALAALGNGLQSGANPATLAYQGVMTQMQSYLLMSHDSASGTLAYDQTTQIVRVDWQKAGNLAPYPRDNEALRRASEAIWATYVPNLIWREDFGRKVVSVHPLGGCPMADSAAQGVTDADCRVYTGKSDNSVYQTLLVCDGSVLPTALGVNPLLTISAVAERAMDRLMERNGWKDTANPRPPRQSTLTWVPPPAAKGWGDTATSISETGVAVDGISGLCARDDKLLAGLGLSALVLKLFPDMDVVALDRFVLDFLDAADLKNDLAPALGLVADGLVSLQDAIDTAIANDSSPVGPVLQALFAVAGDLSPALSFDETMEGFVSDSASDESHVLSGPYELAARAGAAAGHAMRAAFSISTDHLLASDGFGSDIVGATLTGTVSLTGSDGKATTYSVTSGTFDLLQPDPDRIETWLMKYRAELTLPGAAQPTWRLAGDKVLCSRPGSSWFHDLTMLHVDLLPVAGAVGATPLQGIIRLDLQDLAAQLVTITPSFPERETLQSLQAGLIADATARQLTAGVRSGAILHACFGVLLNHYDKMTSDDWQTELVEGLKAYFTAGIAARFGTQIFRTYGGFVSYMNDFPAQSEGKVKTMPVPGQDKVAGSLCQQIPLPDATSPQICLYHFAPPDPSKPMLGPVLLAPGMSTTALSFALLTNKTSLVAMLLEQNYDVWLFDSRLSPRVTPIHTGYTLDDIAAEDWTMAVDYVLANSAVPQKGAQKTVQIVAHCVGALTAQMALLGGHVPTAAVRQLIVMQFTVHPAANWLNVVKSEAGLAQAFAQGLPAPVIALLKAEMGDNANWAQIEPYLKTGMPSVNATSPPPATISAMDQFLNVVSWPVPFGIDHDCLSPTCHRIYALYGPVIAHQNLNEASHVAMRDIFGEIATKPFEQLGLIMRKGRVVTAAGEDAYLPNHERLRLPIHIISGDVNQIVLAESGYRTLEWLRRKMPDARHLFSRRQIRGYAHNDCIIGKNADEDVLKGILAELAGFAP